MIASVGCHRSISSPDRVCRGRRLRLDVQELREVASILVDHVTKSAETRGAFAIGSERKIGDADVHLGFQVVEPLARGRSGLVRVTVHKDRFGGLSRPLAAELAIRSDPDTHAVTWAFRQPATEEAEGTRPFRPTHLMDRVLDTLAARPGPVPRGTLETLVGGKRDYTRLAIDTLATESGLAA